MAFNIILESGIIENGFTKVHNRESESVLIADVPAYAGTDTSTTTTYAFSNNYVNQYTDVAFTSGTGAPTISAGSTVIVKFPFYDVGFFSDYKNVSVNFAGNTNGFVMPIADWIVFHSITRPITSSDLLTVINMKIPGY